MPSGKPIAGYASRSEAIRALADRGLNRAEISRELGLERSIVASLLPQRGTRPPTGVRTEKLPITGDDLLDALGTEERRQLRKHASRRDMSLHTLCLELLHRAATDDLVDAILDDRRA